MKNILTDKLTELKEIKQAAAYHEQQQACVLTGLSGSNKSVFLSALDKACGGSGSLALFVATREEMRAYRRELNYLYPDLPMQELYPVDLPRVQAETQSLELQAGRTAALRFLKGEEKGIVFITAEAWQQKQFSPGSIDDKQILVKVGEICEQQELVKQLIEYGYERTDQVDALGQFCLRGDIMDIYPINSSRPVRIEWFDDEIDAVRSFELESQRSLQSFDEVKIVPLKVSEATDCTASLFDYCSKDTLIIIDEPVKTFSMLEKLDKENKNYAEDLFSCQQLVELCGEHAAVLVSALAHSYLRELPSINIPVRGVAPYNKNIAMLQEDLHGWLSDGITPVIMLSSSIKARGFADNLVNYGLQAVYAENAVQSGCVNVMFGELDHGFRFWDEDWLLLTESDIFGMQKRKRLHSKNQGKQLEYFSDIKAGDYVVHKVHGIGRYIGVENVAVDGVHRDYLLLAYAGDDKLYVPVDQVGMLHKYVGNEGSVPRLSKMGGADWKRTTAKAAKAITELAEELLRLYAQRQIIPGHAFAPDTQWQKEFEDKFPYEETPDQLRAIKEIKADMEKPQPMERLLCGDVGYGKTEVAIRAAFKAVMDGKQVAVMVPTTVLAQQHYLTFSERMNGFGVNVAMLNRFCTAKEQKEIIARLEEGRVDILIGTHRLLQQDIVFRDLGLLIIDEEQRFGVAQKEKIKKWRTGIDVLTLSATPIPRTLHMALVSSRDMSVIESPPEDRLPVETFVAEYNDGMIKEALERELRRGGRIYYIHNRVSGLEAIAGKLRKLVPGISIKIAHGQMSEDALEDAMVAFYEGTCDVLLCTTIVENGLDVPLANTIIIDGAENFGLSQLYQMRGRVGRSSRLAYAYFVYKPNKALSEVAEKRLQAIRDFTELGAGFKIAMRDLEIRGAGNLLGPQQHGHITGIGFAAYCEMLEQTINRLKNGADKNVYEPEPVLEIEVEAYIPDGYIADPRYKMELYRRFAEMRYNERDDLMDEIIDRFGNPPAEVEALWRIAALRGLCRLIKIRGISVRPSELRITFGEHAAVSSEAVLGLLKEYQGRMTFKNGKEPQLIFKTAGCDIKPLDWLEKRLPQLVGVKEKQ